MRDLVQDLGRRAQLFVADMGGMSLLAGRTVYDAITPPYGLCLLIAADLAGLSAADAVRALVPFYLISLAVVVFAVLFPDIVLWIPRLAMAGSGR